jgi:hypothetical protein
MQAIVTTVELKPARHNPLDGFTELTTGFNITDDNWAVCSLQCPAPSRAANAADTADTADTASTMESSSLLN